MNKQRARAYLFICITVIFWGISFFWTNRLLQAHIPVFFLIFTRISLAAVILFVAGRVFGLIEKLKKNRISSGFSAWRSGAFLYFVGESYGVKLTASPSLTSVIVSSIPIFGLIAGVTFYKEKVNALNVWEYSTVPGLLLVVLKMGFSADQRTRCSRYQHASGHCVFVHVGIGGRGSYGHYQTNDHALQRFYGYLLPARHRCTLVILPMLLYDVPKMDVQAVLTDWNFWYPILMLSVFCSSIAFFLFTLAVKELGITRTNTFTSIIPIITAAVGVILGLEDIVWLQASGIFVVVGGVILSQLPSRSNRS